jgi:uncharacterized protein involved in exopolysaccharide biosynthesis
MMMADKQGKRSINMVYYIEILLKRRWFVIIPFCISMIIGITLSVTLPRSYIATITIQIDPKRVSSILVADSDIEGWLIILREQITNQYTLEEIIDKFGMLKEKRYDRIYFEDKVRALRKQITVKVSGKRADVVSISFEGKEPEMVMKVVNSLATIFIDRSITFGRGPIHCVEAIGFLDNLLADTRKKLADAEEKIKEFRKAHQGELSEQLDSNEKVLDRLQRKSAERQSALRDAKNRLADFEKDTGNKF